MPIHEPDALNPVPLLRNQLRCCGARLRTRSGLCRLPPITGCNRCRMHGGASIRRLGTDNPAYRHGRRTQAAETFAAEAAQRRRMARAQVAAALWLAGIAYGDGRMKRGKALEDSARAFRERQERAAVGVEGLPVVELEPDERS